MEAQKKIPIFQRFKYIYLLSSEYIYVFLVNALRGWLFMIRSGGCHVSLFSGAGIAGRLPLARQQLGDAASGIAP